MEYTIGNDNLKFIIKEDGHADLIRGNIIFLCLSESETNALRKMLIDSEQKKAISQAAVK